MATLSRGYTFGATETVTAAKLHALVDSASISNIQTADIADNQITDAKISDVSGAKFTNLSAIPSGAGLIPMTNIFRSGDMLLSSNTTPPAGFTDVSATYENKFIRISSGTPLTTGGADTHNHGGTTGSHALTTNEIPSHKHYGLGMPDTPGSWYYGYQGSANKFSTQYKVTNGYLFGTSSVGGGAGHTHTLASASNVPAYIQLRLFQKN